MAATVRATILDSLVEDLHQPWELFVVVTRAQPDLPEADARDAIISALDALAVEELIEIFTGRRVFEPLKPASREDLRQLLQRSEFWSPPMTVGQEEIWIGATSRGREIFFSNLNSSPR